MNRRASFRFRLYVAGDAPNSVQARTNLTGFCRKYAPGRCEIDVVDVFRDPGRALADRVFMTPTLIKLGPGAVRRIVGTLSDTQVLMEAIGLEVHAA